MIFDDRIGGGPSGPSCTPLKYIMLDAEDFSCLVRGGIIHFGSLRIALQDIGFDVMDEAIHKADQGIDIRKDHIKA